MNLAFAGNGLPLQGSDVAVAWDHLYWFLFWLSVFFFVLVVGAMIVFAFKYRKGKGHKTKYIVDNHQLELVWTIIPTVLLLVLFGWGWNVYVKMTRPPSDAYEIRVLGKQWVWNFQYPDGRMTVGEVFVPAGKPVKFIMTSEDVLHSFFIPNFRVKQDVVPGMMTSLWFEAKNPGFSQVYCTEYCGGSHSMMLAKLYALGEQDWQRFMNGKEVKLADLGGPATDTVKGTASAPLKVASLEEQGMKLTEKHGCIACHSPDGSNRTGPTFKGLFGQEVALADGGKADANEDYVRESILRPQAKVVKGFNPVMPTFQGQLNEVEMGAIVAYIKSLK